MSMAFDELGAQAMKLAPAERLRLAEELYASTDEDEIAFAPEDIAETQRRYEELRPGAVRGESLEEARAALLAPLA